MKIKKLLILVSLFQTGCSGFYGYQPPAPVYGDDVTDPYREGVQSSYSKKKEYQLSEGNASSRFNASEEKVKPSPAQEPSYQRSRMSPAVVALMNESERNSRSGDLESAVVVLERALRLDSRNPMLTYKLSELRIKQEKPRLAEDLAKKAALLAGGDLVLKRNSWLLISRARQMQHNYQGAKEAKIKADSFSNP